MRSRDTYLRRNAAPLSPATPRPSEHAYPPLAEAVLRGAGRLLGYNFVRSKAIHVTGDLYDRCAIRAQEEAHFWYKGASPPADYAG